MLKGFISSITSDGETTSAVIMLENRKSYIVPIEMLPYNIEIDDFVIIDNGIITIDPDTDIKKELLRSSLEDMIKKAGI